MKMCPDCEGVGELLCGLYPPPSCASCEGTGEVFGPLRGSLYGIPDDEPVRVTAGLLRELLRLEETA